MLNAQFSMLNFHLLLRRLPLSDCSLKDFFETSNYVSRPCVVRMYSVGRLLRVVKFQRSYALVDIAVTNLLHRAKSI